MKLSEFDYILPPELIAQTPLEQRDHSRLLVLNRKTGKIMHTHFYDLPDLLSSETIIAMNNTKVFKARLFGTFYENEKLSEVFLLKKVGTNLWQCLCHPGRKFFPGKTIKFVPDTNSNANISKNLQPLSATVKSINEDGSRLIEFDREVEPLLESYGYVPLPPYIKEKAEMDRYQTVYASKSGSVAAPTAGLHFTRPVLEKLRNKGIQTAEITLHVGQGTFLPVKTENIEDHPMHKETFSLSKETADLLNTAKHEGKKILSVGTTTTRVLEHCSDGNGLLTAQSGHSDLFIYPGYRFKFVDTLLTNFHLPKSTLIMLVSAFAGKELTFKAYEEAIKEKYRFYSFGDAMLIL